RALVLAQADLERGVVDNGRSNDFKAMIESLIQNLSDHEEIETAENAAPENTCSPAVLPSSWRDFPVLCVAGRGPLDEAAALLLVDLLGKRGIPARMIGANNTSSTMIKDLDVGGVRVICLSYLESTSGAHAHYLMRRIRKRIPEAQAIAGFWGLSDDNSRFL